MQEIKPVKITEYRGYIIPTYADMTGQYLYSIIDNQKYDHGAFNADFEQDIKYIIDEKLDVIYKFSGQYQGAQLRWFDNGGFRDIQLKYNQRILKLFITPANYILTDLEKNKIIELSESILQRIKNKIFITEI